MAVVVSSEKQLDFNDGIRTNVEIVDGKIQLQVIATSEIAESVYAQSGTIEFPTTDLSQYFREITSISIIKGIPTGTSINVYTSTSNDDITFSPYSLVDVNGLITSPQGRYIKVKAELIGDSQIASRTLNDFVNTEASQFEADDQLVFDGTLKLKTTYVEEMGLDASWSETGILFRKTILKSDYKQIESIEVI